MSVHWGPLFATMENQTDMKGHDMETGESRVHVFRMRFHTLCCSYLAFCMLSSRTSVFEPSFVFSMDIQRASTGAVAQLFLRFSLVTCWLDMSCSLNFLNGLV